LLKKSTRLNPLHPYAPYSQTEAHLYGSSRLAIHNLATDVQNCAANSPTVFNFTRGNKFFELANHLGNVLVTVSDKKIGVDANSDGTIDYYTADVISAQDYYPGGMLMPGVSIVAEIAISTAFKENERIMIYMAKETLTILAKEFMTQEL
jgi:hypothetical protein